MGTLTKSYGQSPSPGTLQLPYSPQAKSLLRSSSQKLLESPAAQKLLTSGQQEKLSPTGVRSLINEYVMRFLCSRFGQPFRQTFARRVCTAVLGTPYSNFYSTTTSIIVLTALARASLNEDPYGRVSEDIPTLIRTYSSVIETIEAFVKDLPPHWTDVEFKDDDRKVKNVEMVVQCLKTGLGEIIQAFGQYAGDLGMEPTEISRARRIAGTEAES